MTVSILPEDVAAAVNAQLRQRGLTGRLHPLDARRLVADATEKFVVLDKRVRPVAFVSLSAPSYPQSVAVAVARAADVQQALGPTLGSVVLQAWESGFSATRSWSVSAYRTPLKAGRFGRRWDAFHLAGPVCRWLADVAEHTVSEALQSPAVAELHLKLVNLAASDPGTKVASAARLAMRDLELGAWRPRTTVSHNDFWVGNLLHAQRAEGSPYRFCVIDWGGALVQGNPIYDLVRMSLSLGLSQRTLSRQVVSHCRALQCDAAHARHYLMSAFGFLLAHRGEWPLNTLLKTATECNDRLADD